MKTKETTYCTCERLVKGADICCECNKPYNDTYYIAEDYNNFEHLTPHIKN